MCRIFGQFGYVPVIERHLQRASISMLHGGPSQQDYQIGKHWGIGCDRLAIQGVIGGNQPYRDQKDICVVFNGEIYNHHILRQTLIENGFSFTDDCDGNIIAPLYMLYGPDFVRYLEGMFAIAIVDERSQPIIHLYSDPAGMKSLYYAWDDCENTLFFASEIEALTFLRLEKLFINPTSLYDYFSLRAVCGENSVFEGIQTLGPARKISCELGHDLQITNYVPCVKTILPNQDVSEAGKQLRELLTKEVAMQTNCDVPYCLVLSGGVDSSLVGALAAKNHQNLHSFHLCYKGDWPFDERKYARELAQNLGTIHHDVELDPDEFPTYIMKMIQHLGQPNWAPHTLSTYCLFEAIHAEGFTVALTGEGADEFYGGYQYYEAAQNESANWLEDYLNSLAPFSQITCNEILHHDYKKYLHARSVTIDKHRARLQNLSVGQERLDYMQNFDKQQRFPSYILRRGDHLSMAHAVELRAPFCQPQIMDFGKRLPFSHRISGKKRKCVVYEAARGLVPNSILNREKQAFIMPIEQMIQKGSRLYDFMNTIFNSEDFKYRGYFNSNRVLEYAKQQAESPNANAANVMWAAMSLELWFQYIDDLNIELEMSVPIMHPQNFKKYSNY